MNGTMNTKAYIVDEVSFKIKPHAHQRCSEGSNKLLCAPGPRDPTEAETEL